MFVVPYKEAYSWRQNSPGGWKQYLVCSCFPSAWKVYRSPEERFFLLFFFSLEGQNSGIFFGEGNAKATDKPGTDTISTTETTAARGCSGHRLCGKNILVSMTVIIFQQKSCGREDS